MRIVSVFAVIAGYTLTSLTLSSCVKRGYNQVSKTQEALSGDNEAKSMGITAVYAWDALQKIKEAEAPHPWSDTYWPLYETGVSLRWMMNSNNVNQNQTLTQRPDSPFMQLNEMSNAVLNRDQKLINLLSPAEKYELVVAGGTTLSPGILQSLKNQYQSSVGTLSQKQSELDAMSKKIDSLESEQAKLEYAIENIKSHKAELQNIIDTNPSQAAAAQIELTKLDADLKIKTDTESALNTKIVDLYTARNALEDNIAPDRKQFMVEQNNITRGPLATAYPMFASGWRDFSYYSAYSNDDNWGWMGHCHGWSAASLIEATPKHGAAIKVGNIEVVFSEGDIRGLLTKVWAEQSTQTHFGGSRCNADSYNKDRRGRILDGTICYNASADQTECSFVEHKKDGKILFLRQQLKQNGRLSGISFVEKKFDTQPKMGSIVRSVGSDNYWMDIYQNVDDYNARRAPVRALVNLSIGCRDLNPGLFHLSLHDLIGVKKVGFVMDQTRGSQVWNQPTYAYKWESIPILKTDKTVSLPDELVSIDQVIDPLKYYRATGTKYLIQVKNYIKYGLENGPYPAYTPKMDFDGRMDIVYTLELNDKKEIIGGEWGLIPIPRDTKNSANLEWMGGSAPDFIWRPVDGTKPTSGKLNYDIISKIHKCSLEKAIEKRVIGGKEISVSVCTM